MSQARPPIPQLVIVGLTAALLVGFFAVPGLRRWARQVDLRALVLVHVTRFVGIYFLILHARGELPWAFAVPGGWGDIVAAASAALVAALADPARPRGRGAILAWNVFGFVDIAMVVATAVRLATADPQSMRALLAASALPPADLPGADHHRHSRPDLLEAPGAPPVTASRSRAPPASSCSAPSPPSGGRGPPSPSAPSPSPRDRRRRWPGSIRCPRSPARPRISSASPRRARDGRGHFAISFSYWSSSGRIASRPLDGRPKVARVTPWPT